MSTDYGPKDEILIKDLFDGRLESFGIREAITDETTSTARCLTDGRNQLWVYGNEEVDIVRRPGFASMGKILAVIAEIFETYFYSEHEPEFWGFESQAECDDAWYAIHKEQEAEFYIEMMKHVRGEPSDIKQGTIGMTKVNIARQLIAENPDLASPDYKENLLQAVNRAYEGDHSVVVELNDLDIATAIMAIANEDDLPQA